MPKREGLKNEIPINPKGEIILNEVFDAKIWAQEFKLIVLDSKIQIDEDLMSAWFANAIMAGYDYAHKNTRPSADLPRALSDIVSILKEHFPNVTGIYQYQECAQAIHEAMSDGESTVNLKITSIKRGKPVEPEPTNTVEGETWKESYAKEFRKVYSGIIPNELIEKSIQWNIEFISKHNSK